MGSVRRIGKGEAVGFVRTRRKASVMPQGGSRITQWRIKYKMTEWRVKRTETWPRINGALPLLAVGLLKQVFSLVYLAGKVR